jgi:hypothetical protein
MTEGPELASGYVQQFILLCIVHNGFRNHPASYPVRNGALSASAKRPEHEADHSPPTSAAKLVSLHGAVSDLLSTGTVLPLHTYKVGQTDRQANDWAER